jgi:hypothetical protein
VASSGCSKPRAEDSLHTRNNNKTYSLQQRT